MKIAAEKTSFHPAMLTMFHELNSDKVAEIVARVAAGETEIPPVLVMNDGYQKLVLDGHHRVAAALEMGWSEIPTYYVSANKAAKMNKAYFGGEWSEDLCGYDDFITVRGQKYSEIRLVD